MGKNVNGTCEIEIRWKKWLKPWDWERKANKLGERSWLGGEKMQGELSNVGGRSEMQENEIEMEGK